MASKKKRQGLRQWLQVLPFIGPSMVLLALFVFYPLVRNILMSFSQYDIIQNREIAYVGISNYTAMFRDGKYLLAFRNTILYTLITVPGQMFFGLILACLINAPIRGKTVFKVVSYLPVLTSWVIVSLIFKYLFMSGKSGLVNFFLLQTGLASKPIAWLQNQWTANVVLWLFGIWKGVGWVMVVYLGALQAVPGDIYEAAQLDGSGRLRTFFHMTIPMVKNTTLYLMTVLMIGGFGAYIHVMMITEGAPLGTTNQIMNLMYDTAFSKYNFGYAAAQAVTMGLIIFLLTLIQRRLTTEIVN